MKRRPRIYYTESQKAEQTENDPKWIKPLSLDRSRVRSAHRMVGEIKTRRRSSWAARFRLKALLGWDTGDFVVLPRTSWREIGN